MANPCELYMRCRSLRDGLSRRTYTDYFTSTSCTSKIRVEFGGMTSE